MKPLIRATRLKCGKCGGSWHVNGCARHPRFDNRFLKVGGSVKSCPFCGAVQELLVMGYEYGGNAKMAKLEGSIDYVLENEGGFTVDDGGPTMWGITIPDVAAYRRVSESSLSEADMRRLSKMEATEIYREQYWNILKLDYIVKQNVATAIFDIGVNRGVSIGAVYAQKAASMLGHRVATDGVIGQFSVLAINVCAQGPFIRALEGLEMAGYQALVAENPEKYGRYLAGWEKRAQRLLTLT